MKGLQAEHCFYTAWFDDAGEFYLESVCGTVGIFSITVKLTAKEIAEHHKNPQSLRTLAQSITDPPGDFLHRRV